MAEDLLDTIGQLFGPLRGGLAYAVIFVGALLAATTGVVAASVISMGLISLPIMLRYGYDRRLATRRHRGFRHAGADHPAVAGADHHGRPARQVGRRHVRRRLHPGPRARRPVCALCRRRDASSSRTGRRRFRWRRARCASPTAAAGTRSLLVLSSSRSSPRVLFAKLADGPDRATRRDAGRLDQRGHRRRLLRGGAQSPA